jgi:hypothetical protein
VLGERLHRHLLIIWLLAVAVVVHHDLAVVVVAVDI